MLQDLAPLPLPLLNDYLVSLIELCMHILRHATIEESVKAAAAQCLIELIESKPKLFSKQGGVNMTLLTCMEIIAQDKTNAAGSLFALPVVQHDDEGKSGQHSQHSFVSLFNTLMCYFSLQTLHLTCLMTILTSSTCSHLHRALSTPCLSTFPPSTSWSLRWVSAARYCYFSHTLAIS